MSDIMKPIKLEKTLNWIFTELEKSGSVFGIPQEKFFVKRNKEKLHLFNEKCDTIIGPAAGPHTQITPNIVAAYLTGSRFFELKTVQILDELDIDKPCIEAEDEGYNTEWSTELTVQQAYKEYVKAWIILHLLDKILRLSPDAEQSFIFNMSVGYDLAGIKAEKIDNFINQLKDASQNEFFQKCKLELRNFLNRNQLLAKDEIDKFVNSIPTRISNSITLSTMHGCPPEEQEAICKYLLEEKQVHTFVKLNPTLLGYDFVRNTFNQLGYDDIQIKQDTFSHDLQFDDAVNMLEKLLKVAEHQNKTFGIKLSNTLPVVNSKSILPGEEMYMSGRALYPLTINLASKIAVAFEGKIPISFSGGATVFNISKIATTGIKPITMATELLKPGGYQRLRQITDQLDNQKNYEDRQLDIGKLKLLAEEALNNKLHQKDFRFSEDMKLEQSLPLTDCFIAPCKDICPIHQNVPEYSKLIAEGRYQEAFRIIIAKNPLPFITGYICDHQCMYKCVRNDYENPVQIRDLKLAAANRGAEANIKSARQPRGKKVAIVGAGPSGLSAGYFLAKQGFRVTIFDKEKSAGGMVRHVIPKFRLPDRAIDKDIKFIKNAGVKFAFNRQNLTIKELKKKSDYIYLAIGAWQSKQLDLGDNTYSSINFLKQFNRNVDKLNPGRKVAVIGGGNSAMDSARAALRCNAVEEVAIVYRRTREFMPADKEELKAALDDGIQFKELLNPVNYRNGILKCQKMQLGSYGADGRRKVNKIEGKFEDLAFDSVITAIGENVDNRFLTKNGIEFTPSHIPENDGRFMVTNKENVFVGGDALRGPSAVVKAIADGKKFAEYILEKENVMNNGLELPDLNPGKRFDDIVKKKGYLNRTHSKFAKEEDVKYEAERCLECNFLCNKCVEVCPNRANIAIKVNSDYFKDSNQILHLDKLCNECGNCETFCPYNGAPYKDKLTLFDTKEEMRTSANTGFMRENKTKRNYSIKIANQIFRVQLNQKGEIVNKDDFEKENYQQLIPMIILINSIEKNYEYLF